jgi:geranylgeranyl diphosphate synthase type I
VTGDETLESALRVVEFKTTKYTIERPLHLGAALAGGCAGQAGGCAGQAGGCAGQAPRRDAGQDEPPGAGRPPGRGVAGLDEPPGVGQASGLAAAYTAYGLPLGLAFQLRDDILGVFGDPAQTGKPAGDDVREGKRTVLLAIARDRATVGQAELIDRYLGDPMLDEASTAEVRAAIAATGALAECERMIASHVSEAIAALASASITDEARDALAELAVAATARNG